MGVSLFFVGVRQQNGCFDTHTFIQFSTYALEAERKLRTRFWGLQNGYLYFCSSQTILEIRGGGRLTRHGRFASLYPIVVFCDT